jgi:hypothetical protein
MSTAKNGQRDRNVFPGNRQGKRRLRALRHTLLRVEALEERQMLSGVSALAPPAIQPLGLLADAYESDNSFAKAKTITVGAAAQTHNIHVQGDADFVKFTLAATSNVMITTSGKVGDTELRLYSSTAAQLAYNNDSGGTFSRITANNLAAGTYYVKVNEFGNNTVIASYSLAVTAKATLVSDAYEVDNTLATAKTFTVNSTTQAHSIHAVGDQDWIRFTLTDATNVLLTTAGTAGDTELTLYNAAGVQLAYNNDYSGTFARIAANNLAAGTYYAKVNEYGNNATIAFYTLAVAGTAVMAADAYEADNTLATAKTITVNGAAQTHSIHNLGDQDWVKFTLGSITNLVITTAGTAGDTALTLYKASGTQLAYNNDSSGSFAKIAVSNLVAGTYYAKVNEYGDNSTIAAYTLTVTGTTATGADTPASDNALAPAPRIATDDAAQTHPSPAPAHLLCDVQGDAWSDVEKSAANTEEDLLCWAATASNMLAWSGWGNAAGMGSAESIFAYFQEHWTDECGHPALGVDWWFDGTNVMQDVAGWSQVDLAGGGFFAPGAGAACLHYSNILATAMSTVASYLDAGYAVGLGLGGPGGHAVTCWGYAYAAGDASSFRGVYLTDSDDNSGADGLVYYAVVQSNGRWHLQDYHGSNDWYLMDVTGLDQRPSATRVAAVAAQGQATPRLLTDEALPAHAARLASSAETGVAEGPAASEVIAGWAQEVDGTAALVAANVQRPASRLQPAHAPRQASAETRRELQENAIALLAGDLPVRVDLAAVDAVWHAFA